MVWLIISVTIAAIYLWWMSQLLEGWEKYLSIQNIFNTSIQPISVVIPFRNEAAHISALLQSIEALEFPKDSFEIVFVDDHSMDNGKRLIENWMKESKVHAQLLNSKLDGKKHAQNLGTKVAKFEHIACTDADCQLPKTWLFAVNNALSQRNLDLAFGPVCFNHNAQILQDIEFNSLIASTMAMLCLKWPVMGNAANMAFKKTKYLEAQHMLQKSNTPSGDDVFLLHHVAKNNGNIGVIGNDEAAVITAPQVGIRAFLTQRIRWAKKARHYQSKTAISVALVVFLTNAYLLAALVGSFIWPPSLVGFVLLFGIKSVADYMLLRNHAKVFNKKLPFFAFLLQEFVNLLYVPLVAVLSQIVPYSWKDRRYSD